MRTATEIQLKLADYSVMRAAGLVTSFESPEYQGLNAHFSSAVLQQNAIAQDFFRTNAQMLAEYCLEGMQQSAQWPGKLGFFCNTNPDVRKGAFIVQRKEIQGFNLTVLQRNSDGCREMVKRFYFRTGFGEVLDLI